MSLELTVHIQVTEGAAEGQRYINLSRTESVLPAEPMDAANPKPGQVVNHVDLLKVTADRLVAEVYAQAIEQMATLRELLVRSGS